MNSPKCVVYCRAAKQYEAIVLADLLVCRRNAANFSRSIIAVSFHWFYYDSETKRHVVVDLCVRAFSLSTRFTIRFCSFRGGSGISAERISFVPTLGIFTPYPLDAVYCRKYCEVSTRQRYSGQTPSTTEIGTISVVQTPSISATRTLFK